MRVVVNQQTLKKEVSFFGLGVHNGQPCRVVLKPAPVNTGIVFHKFNSSTDCIEVGKSIPLEAMHATVLQGKNWLLSTVEHLIAAIRSSDLDNVAIVVDGDEIPILDGSALPFFCAIQNVGFEDQGELRTFITPKKEIMIEGSGGRFIKLIPHQDVRSRGKVDIFYAATFNHGLLGQQNMHVDLTNDFFKKEVAPARTFGFIEQLPYLRKHNLAQGCSLGNTLVLSEEENINEPRLKGEWLRHKLLDFIGDLGLLPHPFTGTIEAANTGHAFNRLIVQHFLENPNDWECVIF